MRNVLIIIALFVVLSCRAQGLSAVDYIVAQNYIVECATDWAESVVTGDVSRRKVYFADEFQGTGVDGGRYDKAKVTREVGPSTEYASNVIGPIEVSFFDSTAIAYGEETWTKSDGTSGRWVWTDIWIHRDGKWQIVAAQDNEVPNVR
ncbi:MAG: hypothetical protein ACI8TQ_002793 [Planctomycetota bacterium]|jgi:hypothetical protein